MDEAEIPVECQPPSDAEQNAISHHINNTATPTLKETDWKTQSEQHQLSEQQQQQQQQHTISEELTRDERVAPPRSKHKKMMAKSSLIRVSSPTDYREDTSGKVNALAQSSSLDDKRKRHSLELTQPYSFPGNNITGVGNTSTIVTRADVISVSNSSSAVTGNLTQPTLEDISWKKRQLSMPVLPTSSTLWHLSSSSSAAAAAAAASTNVPSKPLRDVNFNKLPEAYTPIQKTSPPLLPSSEPPDISLSHGSSASSDMTSLYSASTPKKGLASFKTSHFLSSYDQSENRGKSSLMGSSSRQISTDVVKTDKLTNVSYIDNDKPSISPVVIRRKLSRLYCKDEDEFVGFASLPEQVHRKAVKRGFDFTLMAVGESGLGKSTLISSLFLNPDLYKDRKLLDAHDRISRTVEIEKKYMEIEEKGVKLRLTIIDTPGYNDSVNAEQSTQPIEKYITQQFEQYFKDESGLNRKNIKDYRVHCCLYFISPYGHGLRQTDIRFIKCLQDKVNIVPVIAKADTLTPSEVTQLKQQILNQIDEHNLQIYEFPECDSDEDEDFKKQDSELKAAIPFAVIGSNTVVEVNGKKVRGRLYPWGVVEVDNPQHCDFSKLRMMLISTHMQDLKDVTRDVHYENFRAKQIKEQMTKSQRERNKLKRDSSPNFESIMDQSQLLEQKEEEIRRMQEMIVKMQAQLQNSKRANGAISNGDNNV